MRKSLAAIVSFGTILLPSPSIAHHSFAKFDSNKEFTIHGTVSVFQWTNPHSWIELDAMDGRGQASHYSIEGGSILALSRQGWNRNTIKPGDQITLVAHPLRDGTPGGSLMGIVLANGKRLGADISPGGSGPK